VRPGLSMPCTAVVDAKDEAWRESVLPAKVNAPLAVEAGATGMWCACLCRPVRRVLAIDEFVASGTRPSCP